MTLFHALGPFAAQGGVVAAPGMVLVSPTSITYSGTSATLGANGQVTFTAVTSLSLNGCFTADFDNYVIFVNDINSTGTQPRLIRLRDSGTDELGNYFTQQFLRASSTSVTAGRSTGLNFLGMGETSLVAAGVHVAVYGPNLSQPTAFRSVDVHGESNARITDYAGTHSLSTAYDGFTILPLANTITGKVAVYGIRS